MVDAGCIFFSFMGSILVDRKTFIVISMTGVCAITPVPLVSRRMRRHGMPLLHQAPSSSEMWHHFLYQKQTAKWAPQSSCWALCNWKWLNSVTVEHQRWNVSLPGLVFPPPYFIYGQFGNLGLAHLFLALFMLISLFTLIAPAEVPEPLMG